MDVSLKDYKIFYDHFNYTIDEFNFWGVFFFVMWFILVCYCKICEFVKCMVVA